MNFSSAAVLRALPRGCAFVALALAAAVPASAATINVNITGDTITGMNTTSVALFNASPNRSLRGAIIAVNNDAAGPHTIVLPAGTYTLTLANTTATTEEDLCATGDLDIRKAVTISGAGSASTIIQAGTGPGLGIDKIFSVNPLAVVAGFATNINNVTLRYGRNQIVATIPGNNVGGAMDFDAGATGTGSLTLTSVVFDANQTTNGDGGALATFDGGTVVLNTCTFSNNSARSNSGAAANGGAVNVGDELALGTTVTFNTCTFTGNNTAGTTPGSGGAISSFASGAGVQIILHACTVNGNSVGGTTNSGGGIYASNLTVDQASSITSNIATRWGGGIYVVGGTSTISASTIHGNTAGVSVTSRGTNGGGGGVFVSNGTTTISNSRIFANSAGAGAPSALDTNLAAAVISAANNWFGSNAPAAALFGTSGITTSPNLILTVSASPTTVISGQTTSTVTASITTNSSAASGFTVPNGTPVSFVSVLGSVAPSSSTLVSGVRATIYTPGATGGAGNVSASVDAQTIGANITVNAPPLFTSANNTTFRVGVAGSYNVTASGNPAPTFSFTGSLPSGVNLSAAGVLSGTPAAGTGNATYPITITAANGVAPSASQSFTLTVLSPWQFWQLSNFGANATNPAIAGDNADPDLDGIKNLLEYGWGTDPNARTVGQAVVDTTTGYLRLTTPKVASASDLTYTVEVSDDLVTWTTAGTVVLINTATQLQVRDGVLLTAGSKRFIRLKISRS